MAKRLPRDPDKEKAILVAAVQEFGDAGYRASTDTIAEKAGVSKGSVFRYFDNKKKLYVAVVQMAMKTLIDVVDLSVWTDSDDLVSMIINATRYKTKLSHQYPSEFALLTRVYSQDSMIPPKVRKQVFDIFSKWETVVSNQVINAMLKKMVLRPGLNRDHVKKYLMNTLAMVMVDIQQYFEQHPEVKRMEDMGDIIDEIKEYMDMVENGIVG